MKAFVLNATWDPRPEYVPSRAEVESRKALIGSSVWRHPRAAFGTVETPAPGPDDVIIRQRRVGFCGSDLHFFETDADGYIRYPGLTRFPTILGHELAGDVVEVGSRVTGIPVGEPVTIEDMVRCGTCYPCRINQPNHCENLDEIGFSLDGGFAEYVRVPARNCWSIADVGARLGGGSQLYDCGALVEPFTVVYNALVHAGGGVAPGAYAAVYGAGPIGLASVALLRACGAARVMAFEVSADRRRLALTMGADSAHDPRTTPPDAVIMQETKGLGADIQVEAAGAFTETLPPMERAVSLLGTIVVIGRDASHVSIFPEPLQVKRARLVLAKGNAGMGTYPHVLRLMASGRIDPRPMITARYPFAEIQAALEASRARGHGKILVDVA
jgi:threonine dehydrogenase-like Zn-dependent dehydrogenase